MATKLYVGNLSYQMTDQQLHDLFSEAGNVSSAQVVTDRYTGQARGFGFVEMASEDEAQQAIAAINGRNVGGRALVVNESRPRVAAVAAAAVAAAAVAAATVAAAAAMAAAAVVTAAAVAAAVTAAAAAVAMAAAAAVVAAAAAAATATDQSHEKRAGSKWTRPAFSCPILQLRADSF